MRYTVVIEYGASRAIEVEAESREDALELAWVQAGVCLCYHCSKKIEIGDPILGKEAVFDDQGNEIPEEDPDSLEPASLLEPAKPGSLRSFAPGTRLLDREGSSWERGENGATYRSPTRTGGEIRHLERDLDEIDDELGPFLLEIPEDVRQMNEQKASTPEPAPKNEGEPITPGLLRWLESQGFTAAADLVRERDAYGRAKYGQPLMSDDGRDAVEDCRQELGDALQYAWRAKTRGDDLGPLRAAGQALVRMLFEE